MAPKRNKRQPATPEQRSQEWVRETYLRWDAARGSPGDQRSHPPEQPSGSAVAWHDMGHLAETRAMSSTGEPLAAESLEAPAKSKVSWPPRKAKTLQEAAQFWIEATNIAFTSPASFEPQQYVGVVCGRPVLVIRG